MLGFRVWHKQFYDQPGYMEYYDPNKTNHILFANMDNAIYCNEGSYDDGFYKETNCIPLQFTGLNDFRFKPIYEGDVLFIYTHPNSEDLDNHYYLVEDVKEFLLYLGSIWKFIKKISNDGNIYERPSLLERIK